MPRRSESGTRPDLRGWVVAPERSLVGAAAVFGAGLLFIGGPYATMDALGIRPSPEAAALFRLYGVALLARGLLRWSLSAVADPRPLVRLAVADLVFAGGSALALGAAIVDRLAGPFAWIVVALFALESCWFALRWVWLRGEDGA